MSFQSVCIESWDRVQSVKDLHVLLFTAREKSTQFETALKEVFDSLHLITQLVGHSTCCPCEPSMCVRWDFQWLCTAGGHIYLKHNSWLSRQVSVFQKSFRTKTSACLLKYCMNNSNTDCLDGAMFFNRPLLKDQDFSDISVELNSTHLYYQMTTVKDV